MSEQLQGKRKLQKTRFKSVKEDVDVQGVLHPSQGLKALVLLSCSSGSSPGVSRMLPWAGKAAVLQGGTEQGGPAG